jgi:hypothetical protein
MSARLSDSQNLGVPRSGRSTSARAALAAVIALTLVGGLFGAEFAVSGGGKFLSSRWLATLLWLVPPTALALRLRGCRPRCEHDDEERGALLPEALLLAGMVLFLFSGAAKHRWFYFLNWFTPRNPRPGADCGLEQFVLIAALLWTALLLRRFPWRTALAALLLAAQVAAAWALWNGTGGGQALYGDDHASFLFRLWQFREAFPRLVVYVPFWNAGVCDTALCSTGVAGPGLLLLPLWKLFSPQRVYTLAHILLFIVACPWLAAGSLRMMGLAAPAYLAGGLLTLGVSYEVFLWGLHYGTFGASTITLFILPFSACLYRAVRLARCDWKTAAGLALSAALLVKWPPGVLVAMALTSSVVPDLRRMKPRTWVFLAVCALAVALLSWRQIATLSQESARQLRFVVSPAVSDSFDVSHADTSSPWALAADGWMNLMYHLLQGHPLLVFLGIGGAFAGRHKAVRRWCLPPLLLLALAAGWGRIALPNLQISRLAIPLLFAAVLPAGFALHSFFSRPPGRAALGQALIGALLALTAVNVARIYGNESLATYIFLGDEVHRLTAFIREQCPPGGRVLFAGWVMHAAGGGHSAPLPLLAGREMMGCDYYAFPPGDVEYEYPPRPFRATKEGTHRFLDLHNVRLILTHHEVWDRYLRRQPDRYERLPPLEIGTIRWFAFRVRGENSMFLRGAGTVRATFNHIRVDLADPQAEAVIRYNWNERLAADGGAEIFPYDAGDGIRFIGLRPHGRARVNIRLAGWL